ncbi:hypothetical protein [Paraburkholderia humisilvae]|uniref:Uncharacterized protein n=1 Tax=Paraburkholderia humisilvae TaxID=627669 RepID=A0A6J5DPD8_9BURK|nr:hypothetical protein [Paraburkholderia humisilvae]CAB3754696.1 hypothetical protein LMG29542_02426 [Paraburkholderia humisilvae]
MKPMMFDAWLARANGSSVEVVKGAAGSEDRAAPTPVPLEEVYECACILKSMIDRSQQDQPAGRLALMPLDLPMPG